METQGSDRDEKMEWEFLRYAVIAGDKEHKLWPAEEVNEVRGKFLRLRGSIPSDSELQSQFGEHLETMIQKIVEDRVSWLQLEAQLLGTTSSCHSCSSTNELSYHNFWLAQVVKKDRDWTGSLISIAASAVTAPLLGAAALYGPVASKTASMMQLRLVLCANCLGQRKGIFGGFTVNSKHAQMHPLWKQLNEAGFTEFVDAYDLATKWRR